MDLSFSKHAKERINDRGLSHKMISQTINESDDILQESDCKQIFQKRVEETKTSICIGLTYANNLH